MADIAPKSKNVKTFGNGRGDIAYERTATSISRYQSSQVLTSPCSITGAKSASALVAMAMALALFLTAGIIVSALEPTLVYRLPT